MSQAPRQSRGLHPIRAAAGVFRTGGPTLNGLDADVVRYAAGVSVWGRWFVSFVTLFQFFYRFRFWFRATGYLQKVSGMDRLLSTLKLVAAGEAPVPPEVMRRVFARIRREAEEERDELTGREKEILASFSRGLSYHVIGEGRGVKPVTIRNALYSIQSKLGLGTKQEIVVWAVRNGLLDD